jgi:hypothetical protein
MSEQPWLHVLYPEWVSKQGIVEQINLTDGEIVGCAPVGVDRCELGIRERARGSVKRNRGL